MLIVGIKIGSIYNIFKNTYFGRLVIDSGTLSKLFWDNFSVVILEGRCNKQPTEIWILHNTRKQTYRKFKMFYHEIYSLRWLTEALNVSSLVQADKKPSEITVNLFLEISNTFISARQRGRDSSEI